MDQPVLKRHSCTRGRVSYLEKIVRGGTRTCRWWNYILRDLHLAVYKEELPKGSLPQRLDPGATMWKRINHVVEKYSAMDDCTAFGPTLTKALQNNRTHVVNCLTEPTALDPVFVKDRLGNAYLMRSGGRVENLWRNYRAQFPVAASPSVAKDFNANFLATWNLTRHIMHHADGLHCHCMQKR